jgi:hypothetical protein
VDESAGVVGDVEGVDGAVPAAAAATLALPSGVGDREPGGGSMVLEACGSVASTLPWPRQSGQVMGRSTVPAFSAALVA